MHVNAVLRTYPSKKGCALSEAVLVSAATPCHVEGLASPVGCLGNDSTCMHQETKPAEGTCNQVGVIAKRTK